MLPKEISKLVPKTHLMSEAEWRGIGVQQSQGWIHYMMHEPGRKQNLYKIVDLIIMYNYVKIAAILLVMG